MVKFQHMYLDNYSIPEISKCFFFKYKILGMNWLKKSTSTYDNELAMHRIAHNRGI